MIWRYLRFIKHILAEGVTKTRAIEHFTRKGQRVIWDLQYAGKGRLLAHRMGFDRSTFYDRSARDETDLG